MCAPLLLALRHGLEVLAELPLLVAINRLYTTNPVGQDCERNRLFSPTIAELTPDSA